MNQWLVARKAGEGCKFTMMFLQPQMVSKQRLLLISSRTPVWGLSLKLHHLPQQKVELSQCTTKNDSRRQLMLRLWPRNSTSTWLHRGMWSFLEKLVLPIGSKQIGKSCHLAPVSTIGNAPSTSYSVRGHVLFRVKLEAWNPSRWLVTGVQEWICRLFFPIFPKKTLRVVEVGGCFDSIDNRWLVKGEGCFLLLDDLRFFITWCFGKQVMTSFGKDVSREISSLKRW